MINREDLLAYLTVLNYEPILRRISSDQYQIGRKHEEGCLIRLLEDIEEDSYLRIAIKNRERLNGLHPVGHPQLAEATAEVAELLHAYMIAEDSLSSSSCKDAEQDSAPKVATYRSCLAERRS
jgi:hypothetical protein